MNIYRGCQHQCIYCDSRSECYRIENFSDVLVKVNAVELLEQELSTKRVKGVICTSAMSDPYTKAEATYRLSREALEVMDRFGFPVHTMTKSDLVLRDADVLKKISRIYAAVSFTITTVDDDLARKIEPAASPPSARLAAMKKLSDGGIYTGVTMMPVLPFIEDGPDAVKAALEKFHEFGARFVLPYFGVTLRDRQRAYFYRKLDVLFPGVAQRYRKTFGFRYPCDSPRAKELYELVKQYCKETGMTMEMKKYVGEQERLV